MGVILGLGYSTGIRFVSAKVVDCALGHISMRSSDAYSGGDLTQGASQR